MLLRLLSWLIGVPLAGSLVLFAISNRQDVTLSVWPLSDQIVMPVYAVALLPLAVGLLAGATFNLAALVSARASVRYYRHKVAALGRDRTSPAAVTAAEQGLTSP